MTGLEGIGRLLLILGIAIAILGLILTLAGRVPWLGRLPGDLVIQRDNVSCFLPLATMIVLSLALTVIANLVLWLLRR